MSGEVPTQLDHIVLLLPYRDILDPPAWVRENFTISSGGRHADGKTENRLVLFEDGTYLELIAFVNDDPQKRAGHWWDKPFGIIDFALTTKGELDHGALQKRLADSKSGISYAEPRAGGRITENPTRELRWKVTFPEGAPRGAVPFWCHDVTTREWRVPTSAEKVQHPCGASGVAGVVIHMIDSKFTEVKQALSAITQVPLPEHKFSVGSPKKVDGSAQSSLDLKSRHGVNAAMPKLDLVLRSRKRDLPDIQERIGDGELLIKFVP